MTNTDKRSSQTEQDSVRDTIGSPEPGDPDATINRELSLLKFFRGALEEDDFAEALLPEAYGRAQAAEACANNRDLRVGSRVTGRQLRSPLLRRALNLA